MGHIPVLNDAQFEAFRHIINSHPCVNLSGKKNKPTRRLPTYYDIRREEKSSSLRLPFEVYMVGSRAYVSPGYVHNLYTSPYNRNTESIRYEGGSIDAAGGRYVGIEIQQEPATKWFRLTKRTVDSIQCGFRDVLPGYFSYRIAVIDNATNTVLSNDIGNIILPVYPQRHDLPLLTELHYDDPLGGKLDVSFDGIYVEDGMADYIKKKETVTASETTLFWTMRDSSIGRVTLEEYGGSTVMGLQQICGFAVSGEAGARRLQFSNDLPIFWF